MDQGEEWWHVNEKITPAAGNAEGEIGRMQREKRVALPNEHSAKLEGKTENAVNAWSD